MKVLLRDYSNELYVWKKAVYHDSSFYIVNSDGLEGKVVETNIVSIERDRRKNYVVCRNCGKLIKGTDEEIKKHYAQQEDSRDCLKCLYIGGRKKQLKMSYTLQEDGSYKVVDKFTAKLCCDRTYYPKHDINSDNAKRNCTYYKCRQSGVKEINDVFIKYPKPFDIAITADVLQEKKWKYDVITYDQKYFIYDGKQRNALKAMVNMMGIIDYFSVSDNKRICKFYYSLKYDKVLYESRNTYQEGVPWNMSKEKYDRICKKIRELYKGVEVDE